MTPLDYFADGEDPVGLASVCSGEKVEVRIVVSSGSSNVQGSLDSSAAYRAGLAKVVITPVEPMWAAGYGSRDKPIAEKEVDLHAKALVLEDKADYRLVIVTTDLLGLPRTIAEPVAEAVCRQFKLGRDQVVLSSSHTHCGPVLASSLVDLYPITPPEQAKIDRYSDLLEGKLVQVVSEAMADLSPARLACGLGEAGFAVNRREPTPEGIINRCNREGPVDHDVPVLRVATPDGSLRAILFGYACHCTTMSYFKWSGDYAGFAQANLERSHPGATAMFFAGCGADANPLPRQKLELCVDYGKQLSDSVEGVLAGGMAPINGAFAAAFQRIDLPFDTLPTRQELELQSSRGEPHERSWAKRLSKQLDTGAPLPTRYPYPIQVVQLGSGPTLVALGGEVVVDYSHRLKQELGPDRSWVMAYANDVMAYIPSQRVLAEGGYEGDGSMQVYGLPAKWTPMIEEKIISAVQTLARQVRR